MYVLGAVQEAIPPMMSFHVGSLGFLTHFVYENHQQDIRRVIEGVYMYNTRVLTYNVRTTSVLSLCLGSGTVKPLAVVQVKHTEK